MKTHAARIVYRDGIARTFCGREIPADSPRIVEGRSKATCGKCFRPIPKMETGKDGKLYHVHR